MRFCGGFLRWKQVSCSKKRHQTHSAARESVHSALFAIQHADCDSALETGLADGLDRVQQRTAGGDNVLDQADSLTGLEGAFEAVRGSVLLGRGAHDHERDARRERRRGRERYGTQLRTSEPRCVGLVLGDLGGKVLAERREHVRLRLEAVLVEVVARPAARAEDEVALEVRVVEERGAELVALHAPTARRASRACARSTAACGESPWSETSEPSAK